MTARCALPQRRFCETFNFRHWEVNYTVGVGRYPDGRPGEVFINCDKIGTAADVLGRESAVIVSLALQYGVPLTAMLHAIPRDPDGKPSGPTGALLEKIAEDEGYELERAVRSLG
jgi:hypothetical protein